MFLFLGLILAVFVIRGGRILLILGGQALPGGFRPLSALLSLLFLAATGLSLLHGRWIVPVVITPAT